MLGKQWDLMVTGKILWQLPAFGPGKSESSPRRMDAWGEFRGVDNPKCSHTGFEGPLAYVGGRRLSFLWEAQYRPPSILF